MPEIWFHYTTKRRTLETKVRRKRRRLDHARFDRGFDVVLLQYIGMVVVYYSNIQPSIMIKGLQRTGNFVASIPTSFRNVCALFTRCRSITIIQISYQQRLKNLFSHIAEFLTLLRTVRRCSGRRIQALMELQHDKILCYCLLRLIV